MRERYKCYRTKKEVALDKLTKTDVMSKNKPKEHATEVLKRPPYSVGR